MLVSFSRTRQTQFNLLRLIALQSKENPAHQQEDEPSDQTVTGVSETQDNRHNKCRPEMTHSGTTHTHTHSARNILISTCAALLQSLGRNDVHILERLRSRVFGDFITNPFGSLPHLHKTLLAGNKNRRCHSSCGGHAYYAQTNIYTKTSINIKHISVLVLLRATVGWGDWLPWPRRCCCPPPAPWGCPPPAAGWCSW